jgi:hypothetical protein
MFTPTVGIDNMNNYYDVELKRDRAYELHKAGIKLYKADVCDGDFLHGMVFGNISLVVFQNRIINGVCTYVGRFIQGGLKYLAS